MSACTPEEKGFLVKYTDIDLLIQNGVIIDGSGTKPIRGDDIVIVDDEIVFVGKTHFSDDDLQTRIKQVIDAHGRVISPGFIDLHSHGDPLATPDFENFLAMGVTTITLGQDGESPNVPDLSAWLKKVSDLGIGPNLAMFVGHGTLRDISGIGLQATPGTQNLQRMLTTLDNTLEYTFGMSTGLEYNPGLNAKAPELAALAKVVGKHKRLIMSHIRSEDDDQIVASIEELIAQGEYADVHISHLKSVYGHGASDSTKVLDIIHQAQSNGTHISADLYPYNASYTGISIVFPIWSKTLAQFEVAKRERRSELESFLRKKIIRRNGPSATLLGTPPYTGKTLADLAAELEMPFEQVLIDEIGPKGASGAYFVMDDELQSKLLAEPFVSISSDGSPKGFHPRGHGAFAKIIEEYVNKRQLISLEEAVRKMTSQAADILKIKDRGRLAAGYKADLLIFDPDNIHESATYPKPHQLAQGFDIVIINGRIARQNNQQSDALFGRVLKPSN